MSIDSWASSSASYIIEHFANITFSPFVKFYTILTIDLEEGHFSDVDSSSSINHCGTLGDNCPLACDGCLLACSVTTVTIIATEWTFISSLSGCKSGKSSHSNDEFHYIFFFVY
jgi:hypothetical protein